MEQTVIQIDREGKIALDAGLRDSSIIEALRPLVRTMPDGSCTNTSGCNCTGSNPICGCN